MKNRMKISKYARFIKREKDWVVFHSQIGNMCSIDSTIYDILSNLKEINEAERLHERLNISRVEIDEVLKEFLEKKIIAFENNDVDYLQITSNQFQKYLHRGTQIRTIQLIMSNQCNFNCKYCFENSIYCSREREIYQKIENNQTMDGDDAVRYILTVIKIIKENKQFDLHIQFFGGEPLMNKPAIKKVLKSFGQGDAYGVNITYSIVTNGSLIEDEIAGYFKKYNVAVIVSFDNPNISDRAMASGKSSLEAVLTALQILKNHGNYIAFNSVLSSHTYSYFNTDIIDCAKKYNVKEVGIVMDLDYEFYRQIDITNIVKKIIKVYLYARKEGIIVSGYWMSTYLSLFEDSSFTKGFKTCTGTGNQFSIEPAGAVFACKGSSGYYGMIDDLEWLFQNEGYLRYAKRSIINSSQCKNCFIEGFCSGFCLGPLEKNFNNIEYIEEYYCKFMEELTKNLILLESNIDKYEIA